MAALCGIDFGDKISEDDKESVTKDLKAPILNNIALCMMKQKKYARANLMLD